ncbi:hypothetical protein QFZ81_000771 [Paenibacillus sp. V4I9]|nr:hypothetical protein [Paenibacillus sp. V4I9]
MKITLQTGLYVQELGIKSKIIFCTAYDDQYAIEACRIEHIPIFSDAR